MRLAAAKYVAEHRNPGYSRGITRKTCAETLAAKWPLRLGRPEPEVREINADQIAGNGGAHAPAKKSLSTALPARPPRRYRGRMEPAEIHRTPPLTETNKTPV